MSSNFDFLKEINPDIFSVLSEIEKESRIKPISAGRNCRTLLDMIVDEVFSFLGIHRQARLADDLVEWRKADPQLFSQLKTVEFDVYDLNNKRMRKQDCGLFFIKDLANFTSHISGSKTFVDPSPRPCYKSLATALRAFHDFFRIYYAGRELKILPFNESLIPVGEYEIQERYVPADTNRSKCDFEYKAIRRTGTYSRAFVYAIIREYDPDEMDRLFLSRNIDAFSESLRFTYSNGVSVKALNSFDEKNASFFMAYEFVRPVTFLEPFLKNTHLEIWDRINLCYRIAGAIKLFHDAEDPIYHRMLSYESVVVSDFTDEKLGYHPYIIKFDFAKITSIKEGTVFKQLSDAESLETMKLARYRTDELSPETKWEKVDIFSLGVLLIDILRNSVSSNGITEKTFEELEDEGVSNELLDVIDRMLNEIPEQRPEIDEVLAVIAKEQRVNG